MTEAKRPKIPPLARPTVKLPPRCRPGREFYIEYLVKQHNWQYGCELGVWRGRTFLHLLNSCPSLTMIGVDLWAPQPDNEGPENYVNWPHAKYEKMVRDGSKDFEGRAIIYKMLTDEAADLVNDESLDFVFIDADHSSEAVRNDILKWTPKVKPSGFIIGHDINWDTVKIIVDELVPGYSIGPDNLWFRRKAVKQNAIN